MPGPKKCICNKTQFYIYKGKYFATSICSFRCINNSCIPRFQIRINSFFEKFPYVRLDIVLELINYIICLELNISKTIEYINNKNVNISKKVVKQAFNEIKNI